MIWARQWSDADWERLPKEDVPELSPKSWCQTKGLGHGDGGEAEYRQVFMAEYSTDAKAESRVHCRPKPSDSSSNVRRPQRKS